MNSSDAGGTYLLTAVRPTSNCPDVADPSCIIDKSRQIAGQLQYGINLGTRQRFILGYDYINTMRMSSRYTPIGVLPVASPRTGVFPWLRRR